MDQCVGKYDPNALFNYADRLTKLEQIRALFDGHDIPLPEIVVVGPQSAGKSSLLEELTTIRLPVDSKTCTTCPIVVSTRHADKEKYEVEENGGEWHPVDKEALAEKIAARQGENVPDGHVYADSPVSVKAHGPTLGPCTIVDLPGLVAASDEPARIAHTFLKNPNALIVNVFEANWDPDNATGTVLAKQHDSYEERTLTVFSKCDVLVALDDPKQNETVAEKINKGIKDTLGAHAVICRPQSEAYSAEKERDGLNKLFGENPHCGVEALRKRLGDLLLSMVNKQLPHLRAGCREKKNECQKKLEEIGEQNKTPEEVLLVVKNLLTDKMGTYEEATTPFMESLREKLYETNKKCTRAWTDPLLKKNVWRPPFFQGDTVFTHCILQMAKWWEVPIRECLVKVLGFVHSHFDVTSERTVSRAYLEKIRAWFMELETTMKTEAKRAVKQVLLIEQQFKTMNHYLDAKFMEKTKLPEELLVNIEERVFIFIQDTIREVEKSRAPVDHLVGLKQTLQNARWREHRVKQIVREVSEKYWEDYGRKSLHEQQQVRFYNSVKAYWCVAHKNVLDNVMGAIRVQIQDPLKKWITTLSAEGATESAGVRDERRKWAKNKEKYEEALLLLID